MIGEVSSWQYNLHYYYGYEFMQKFNVILGAWTHSNTWVAATTTDCYTVLDWWQKGDQRCSKDDLQLAGDVDCVIGRFK